MAKGPSAKGVDIKSFGLLHRFFRPRVILLELIVPILFTSCSNAPSSINICGIFPKNDSLIFTVGLKGKDLSKGYQCAGAVAISANPECQCISIPIPDSLSKDIIGLELLIRNNPGNTILLKSIKLDGIAKISGVDLMRTFSWQGVLTIEPNSENDAINCYIPLDTSGEVLSIGLNRGVFFQQREEVVKNIFFWFFFLCLLIFIVIQIRFVITTQPLLSIGIISFLLTLPLKISYTNWALMFLGVISLISFIVSKSRKVVFSPPFYGIIALYGALLLGLFYSIDFNGAIKELSPTMVFLILPTLFGLIQFSKITIENIFLCFVRGVGLFCLLLLINYCYMLPALDISSPVEVVNKVKIFSQYLFFHPSFTHPSFISVVILMPIPIATYLRFGNVEKKISWVEFVLCIMSISVTVFLSGARIGLITLPLLTALGLLFYLPIKQQVKYTLFAITIGIAVFGLLRKTNEENKFNDPIREDLRKTAITAIKERPLFGWGTGSMKYLLYNEDIAHKAGLEKPIAEFNHFHNQYLDEIVQFGLIGSLPFFGLFAYLIYLAIKKRDFLLMAYLAIYLPFMFVESPFATVKGIQPMIFWLCFFLSTQKTRCPDNTIKASPSSE